MTDNKIPDSPSVSDPADPAQLTGEPTFPGELTGWARIWDRLLRLGLGEIALRTGTAVVSIVLFLIVIWAMRTFYVHGANNTTQAQALTSMPTPTITVVAPDFEAADPAAHVTGISRLVLLHTVLPSRPRFEITSYTVQKGDSVIAIAEKFNLDPRTILWGNFDILADNPEFLAPDQVLNILPSDGVLYTWHLGDGLNGVAEFFGVTPDDIIDWPGNHLDRASLGDFAAPAIKDGTKLFIPGGKREFTSWSAPRVTRENPGAAKGIGSGVCGDVAAGGYIGSQTWLWPTTEHFISGYHFDPSTNHPAVDIGGKMGNPIFAADNGVIVYAGWSDLGYGNMIMIDHGDGWQTLYAHLSEIYVSCGQSVFQGATLGLMGSTGRSSGPHLHFEMRSDTLGKVNALDYMQ